MRRYLLVLTLVGLAACAPVQQGVQDAVRAVAAGDDGATLVIHDVGVTFNPGVAESATQVVLYVGGESLREAEEACRPLGNGVACFLGDVSAPETVGVTGRDLSANVSYYRDGPAPLFFYVRE